MRRKVRAGLFLSIVVAIAQFGNLASVSAADKKNGLHVVSEQTITGFAFPESVGCDPKAKLLYVSQFGSALKPAEKDGKGKIAKVSMSGKVLEDQFLPAHGEVLNKPKGIWIARDGSLLMAGFKSDKEARGIYALGADGKIKTLAKDLGRLDGLYQMNDGTLLATDWNSGSLFQWSPKGGMQTLTSGFKGPADLCVVPEGKGYLVVVPDLVKSELRMVHLAR